MSFHEGIDKIYELVVGHEVKSIDGDSITLDNGVTLTLYESVQDCCAGANGEWTALADDFDQGGITDVNIEYSDKFNGDGAGRDVELTVTLLAGFDWNARPVVKAECFANNGNGGYYFSVLSLRVTIAGKDDESFGIISA